MGWISGALNAVGNITSSFINNAINRSENKKAYERNLAMWNMENEYNHPVQQMARLREAGLNPNLVYGSGATTLAASTKSAQPANVSFPQLDALQMMNAYQDLKQKDAMTENIKAQKAEVDARRIIAEEQAKKLGNDNAFFGKYGYYPVQPSFKGHMILSGLSGNNGGHTEDPNEWKSKVVVKDKKKPAIGSNVVSVPDGWFPRLSLIHI